MKCHSETIQSQNRRVFGNDHGPFMSVFAFLLLACSCLSALLVCPCLCVVLYKIRPLEPEKLDDELWFSTRFPLSPTLRVIRYSTPPIQSKAHRGSSLIVPYRYRTFWCIDRETRQPKPACSSSPIRRNRKSRVAVRLFSFSFFVSTIMSDSAFQELCKSASDHHD